MSGTLQLLGADSRAAAKTMPSKNLKTLKAQAQSSRVQTSKQMVRPSAVIVSKGSTRSPVQDLSIKPGIPESRSMSAVDVFKMHVDIEQKHLNNVAAYLRRNKKASKDTLEQLVITQTSLREALNEPITEADLIDGDNLSGIGDKLKNIGKKIAPKVINSLTRTVNMISPVHAAAKVAQAVAPKSPVTDVLTKISNIDPVKRLLIKVGEKTGAFKQGLPAQAPDADTTQKIMAGMSKGAPGFVYAFIASGDKSLQSNPQVAAKRQKQVDFINKAAMKAGVEPSSMAKHVENGIYEATGLSPLEYVKTAFVKNLGFPPITAILDAVIGITPIINSIFGEKDAPAQTDWQGGDSPTESEGHYDDDDEDDDDEKDDNTLIYVGMGVFGLVVTGGVIALAVRK